MNDEKKNVVHVHKSLFKFIFTSFHFCWKILETYFQNYMKWVLTECPNVEIALLWWHFNHRVYNFIWMHVHHAMVWCGFLTLSHFASLLTQQYVMHRLCVPLSACAPNQYVNWTVNTHCLRLIDEKRMLLYLVFARATFFSLFHLRLTIQSIWFGSHVAHTLWCIQKEYSAYCIQ